MSRQHVLKLVSVFMVVAVVVAMSMATMSVAPAHADSVLGSYAGTIASGPQYDLYTLDLRANAQISAIVYCDPAAPTLDSILTVFFPGSDTSDTSFADVYNDDGGTQVCGGFRNSVVVFVTPVAGVYTFRVDGFGSATGDYTLQISDSTGCVALMPLPTTAVVGSFLSDATLYAVPGVAISPTLTIEAGKTAWVTGVDTSGQYYQVMWACSVLWVDRATMGPNYDDVWQGRPLPTNVIDTSAAK